MRLARLLTLALFLAACGTERPRPNPTDSGMIKPDAGETSQDAASSMDASVESDSGVTEDASADVDARVVNDAGPPPEEPLGEADLLRKISMLASEEWMGRNEGSPGHEAARAFIIAELERCGVLGALPDGTFEQPITTGVGGVNVLGWIEGTDSTMSARTVVVSAHYDHLGPCGGGVCLGADDNAAGVAIALGVACAFTETRPSRSVMIALWDAEEPPTFLSEDMGSQFYADNPVIPLSDLDAVLVMDLVGGDLWSGFPAHFVFGAELSPELDAAVTTAPVPAAIDVGLGGYHLFEQTSFGVRPLSDYYPFRVESVPTLFFTNGQNKRYHTPEDVVAAVNIPKVAAEAQYLLAVAQRLANATTTPTFVASGERYARDAETIAPVLDAALAPGGMADQLGISAQSRTSLEADVTRVQAVLQKVANGDPLNQDDADSLRSATQRVNCLTGSELSEIICNML